MIDMVFKWLTAVRTVLWEKWVEFKFEWLKITASSLISPLLYMVALGWGLGAGRNVGGQPYINFLVPGIIALTTMNTSFSSVGNSLNVQRLFEHSFDLILASPTPMPAYIIGQMLGGALRGIYSGMLILLLSIPFGATMCITPLFFVIMLLNGMVFAALGVLAAILASSHTDISRFSSFVILPMTFLCNTLFPLDTAPKAVQAVIRILPLTHSSASLRSIAYGEAVNPRSIVLLLAFLTVFMVTANLVLVKRKNF